MAIKKRPRVGTILGTEGRNDDDTIERTPGLAKYLAAAPVSPGETVLTDPVARAEPAAPTASREGDGPETRDGGILGDKDKPNDGTDTAVAAASASRSSTPPGTRGMIDTLTSALNSTSSELFGTFGEKPGLGFQSKSQLAGTLAQARSRVGPDEEEEETGAKYGGYAPAPPSKTEEPAYNPAENADLGRGLGPAGQDDKSQLGSGSGAGLSPTDGSFAAFGGQEHGNSKAPGVDERGLPGTEYTGSSGTGNRDKQGATGQDKGDTGDSGQGNGGDNGGGGQGGGGTGGATGGEGASGDSSGGGQGGTGTGGGAFHKGGIVKGKNPKVKGEEVNIKAKEDEGVLNVPATTIIGKDRVVRVNKIALMKKLSREEKNRRIKRTIVS